MTDVTDPFKNVFLAGIGALAIGAEKSQEILDQLIQKGQITVDQGKEIASELQSDATAKTAELRDQIIQAQMKTMSKAERDAFSAKVAEMAATVDGDDALEDQEEAEVAHDLK